jgi:hypothetical protein
VWAFSLSKTRISASAVEQFTGFFASISAFLYCLAQDGKSMREQIAKIAIAMPTFFIFLSSLLI